MSAGNSSLRTHAKNDFTRYSYYGRSCDVASSVGLVSLVDGSTNTMGFTFFEAGYVTSVSCTHNATSAWAVSLYEENGGTYPDIYIIQGPLPNEHLGEYYATVGLGENSSSIVALVKLVAA